MGKTFKTIKFEAVSGVGVLTLSRPDALNALTLEMIDEIVDVIDYVDKDPAIRSLLLAGAGRAFCAGADMMSGTGANQGGRIDAGKVLEIGLNPLMRRLAQLDIPIVAAVNGAAVGAGCSIALAADVVVSAKSAYFLLAFTKVGLVPDCGITWVLPRLVGGARAQAMMLLAEKIPSETARDWGLVFDVAEDDALHIRAMAIANQLARGPTRSYALIRSALRQCWSGSYAEALIVERENQKLAGESLDFAEGVAAFREKRAPVFKGI